MSKNFEQEYKALANEDLPDLWNRIENGLAPRTTALTDEADQDVKQEKRKAAPFLVSVPDGGGSGCVCDRDYTCGDLSWENGKRRVFRICH